MDATLLKCYYIRKVVVFIINWTDRLIIIHFFFVTVKSGFSDKTRCKETQSFEVSDLVPAH